MSDGAVAEGKRGARTAPLAGGPTPKWQAVTGTSAAQRSKKSLKKASTAATERLLPKSPQQFEAEPQEEPSR